MKDLDTNENDSKPAAIVANDTRASPIQEHRVVTQPVSGEIPFLITHWLDGLTTDTSRDNPEIDHAAMQSIRNATATLASAFESLGSFGQRLPAPRLASGTSSTPSQHLPVNKSYADMKRTWAAACPPTHLERLLESSNATNEMLDVAATTNAPTNSEKRCGEILIEQRRKAPGRTLNDAINVEQNGSEPQDSSPSDSSRLQSALHKPPLVVPPSEPIETGTGLNHSSLDVLRRAASKSKRKYLDTLQQSRQEEIQISSHQKSLEYQRRALSSLQDNSQSIASSAPALVEDIESSQLNCRRVIAQIERVLPSLLDVHLKTRSALDRLQAESQRNYERLKVALSAFRDPIMRKSDYKGNLRLHSLISQQLKGFIAKNDIRKGLLYNRLAHMGTINTHLTYPVFCLKFDKTGRYFITGADDYLVKIFRLASALHRRVDKEQIRGAVLVCTLKGHAGVINDIQVSSDNCFVATASEDGDVRVWGLHNGCPIAILRGHVGGANMVSWSLSTPYRLVTTGADGLARVWDIRVACLSRYKKFVGERIEYNKTNPNIRFQNAEKRLSAVETTQGDQLVSVDTDSQYEPQNIEIPLPPIPLAPGANGILNAEQGIQQIDNISGQFVANDRIDDGVKLVSKLRHGAPPEAQDDGVPSTRSRLSTVKVICVALCPKGGHFATGSDDGVCRVWNDIPDDDIFNLDRSAGAFDVRTWKSADPSINLRLLDGKPLLELKGDPSAITDLEYSKEGDRLMAASQKDGAVRIWSWSIDPSVYDQNMSLTEVRQKRITSHLLIRLSNPKSQSTVTSRSRARPNRVQSTDISCDVARWLSDDLRIVTSQCEYTRQNASAIVPGSQFLFVWDSFKGHCLMCIDNPHRMQCPLVLSHPQIPSILCSAGADGLMKVWNLEQCECIYTFENLAEYGPFDPNDRGKSVGFLDGDFSPDGVDLVLTDDSGRVVVFTSGGVAPSTSFPGWAREQYFSNDYYDLVYDTTGYCVERGSETPPHLAPKGSRCTHSGSPFSAHVNETLSNIHGPPPLTESTSSWTRLQKHEELARMRASKYNIGGNIVGRFDPATTVIIHSNNESGPMMDLASFRSNPLVNTEQRESNSSRRHLSSNYRWMDYEDLDGVDDNEVVDPDDEEFDPSENRRRTSRPQGIENDSGSEDDQLDGFDADNIDDDTPSRTVRNGERHDVQSQDSADDDIEEILSTNNTPSGPFVADYSSHFFKMANQRQGNSVHRRWLQRVESTSSYEGRRRYAPQLGDAVIYIPRAHYDTIARFPSLEAPWLNWPDNSVWPIVQCCVRNIRYRFPYLRYREGCRSIVAKVTLELTGVPQVSLDRQFGWPAASFQSPQTDHVFEISVFENDDTDFLIPIGLYQSRVNQLEHALASGESVMVDAFYATENEDEEFLSYPGKVAETLVNPDSVDLPSLVGSGYHSVGITWPDEPSTDYVSPWELSVRSPESSVAVPSRPRLDEADKRTIRDTLNHLRSMPEVMEDFGFPVSETYSDYNCRVELPTDLSFVADRVEADYYATKFSFVADIRLIFTNCVKYNGEQEPLCFTAKNMLDEATKRVLNESERLWFHAYDQPLPGSQPTGNLLQWDTSDEGARVEGALATAQRRRTEQRQPNRSSFENLSQPDETTRRSSRAIRPPTRLVDTPATLARRSSRRMPSRPQHLRSTRAASRSVLEGPIRTLEQLSSRNGATWRGRSTGHRGRLGRDEQAQSFVRRSSRNRHENPVRQSTRPGLRNAQPAAVQLRSIESSLPQSSRQRRREASVQVEEAPFADPDSSSAEANSEEEYSRNAATAEASTEESEAEEVESREQRARPQRQSKRKVEVNDEESSESDESIKARRNGARKIQVAVKKTEHSDSDADSSVEHRPPQQDADTEEEFQAVSSDDFESDEDDDESAKLSASDDSIESRFTKKRKQTSSSRRAPRRATARLKPEATSSRKRRRQSNSEGEAQNLQRFRTRRVQAAYEDPSSSDFNDESDEERSPGQHRAPATKKRKGSNDVIRKRKAHLKKRMKHHDLSGWPGIALGHITKVTNEIVKRFRELDEEGMFHLPVAVAYPEIAQAYKKSVEFPMDFRTIVEDRVHVYQSIQELQEDLLLVFDNCIIFNEEGTQFHDTATTMIDLMGSTFEGVLDDLNIRSLRH